MKINTITKFNLGDPVKGTIIFSGENCSRAIEGKIKHIIAKYGPFVDPDDYHKPMLDRYSISYIVENEQGAGYEMSESSLTQCKRSLDRFSTKELEEEIERRKNSNK